MDMLDMIARDKAEDLCLAMNNDRAMDLKMTFMPVHNIDEDFMRVSIYPLKEFSYFDLIDYGEIDGIFSIILSYRDFSEVVIEWNDKKWRVAD